MFRKVSWIVLAIFFIVAGANHFLSTDTYVPLMPGYLPWPVALIYLSGVAEILGGAGILFRKSRSLAGWWLIAVLVAVFPANIHMLVNHVPINGKVVPEWVLWIRLPLQGVLACWIYKTCVKKSN